jgi:hypothetical protein
MVDVAAILLYLHTISGDLVDPLVDDADTATYSV